MTPSSLLWDLLSDGFTLQVTAGKLVIQPASKLTDALRAAVREHKAALVALLGGEGAGGPFAAEPPRLGWAAYYSGLKPWPVGSIGARFLAAGGRG